MEPLKLLVIGMDPPVHFNLMTDPELIGPHMRLAALAASHPDPHEVGKLKELAGRWNVDFATHWKDLIGEVDAAVYLGPYGYRGKVYEELLQVENLKALIIDKPLASTTTEVESLEALWRSRGDLDILPLLTVRYDLRYELIKAIYESGIVGQVIKVEAWRPHKLGKRPAWFFDHETYPGVIRDLCVHDVDIVTFITGHGVETVSGAYEVAGRADDGQITIYGGFAGTLDNGAAASFSGDWLTGPHAPYHGDTGICLTSTEGKIELISDGASKGFYVETGLERLNALEEIFTSFKEMHSLDWKLGTLDKEKGYFKIHCSHTDYRLDFKRTLQDFFAFRAGERKEPVVTMEDLVRATKITTMAREMI